MFEFPLPDFIEKTIGEISGEGRGFNVQNLPPSQVDYTSILVTVTDSNGVIIEMGVNVTVNGFQGGAKASHLTMVLSTGRDSDST